MGSELSTLAAAIDAGSEPFPLYIGKLIKYAPESFDDQRAGQIAVTVRAMRAAGETLNAATVAAKCPNFVDFIISGLPDPLPLAAAEYYAVEHWQNCTKRRLASVGNDLITSLEGSPERVKAIATVALAALESIASDSSTLVDKLATRIYSPLVKPYEPSPRFSIHGVPICTPANLTTISAQAKAGKSAGIGAMIASTFAAGGSDCLGFSSQNPDGLAVIHFDTEQSRFDHWDAMNRAVRRAGIDTLPPWLRSYCLTGFSPEDVRAAIRFLITTDAKQFGGVHSVFIDGAADAVQDVNDPAETCGLVTELHRLAIEFDCPILNVIHVNPGSDFKTRGHLGSQLERKSETNLRLEKDADGVTVIWADKNRRAPIPKTTGPRFIWNGETGMHVSIQSMKSSKDELERETLTEFARDVFSERPAMRYADLQTTVKTRLSVSDRTAERKVMRLRQLGIVKKTNGNLYVIGI